MDVETFDRATLPRASPLLLRLSDPLMLEAARALTDSSVAYAGPGVAALTRCYDKLSAYDAAAANDIAFPETRLAEEADALPRPIVLKPRQGSDSIGLRLLRAGPVPARLRNDRTLAQSRIVGAELTVGVMNGTAGAPLRIALPDGIPNTFRRKYLLRPRRRAIGEGNLAARVRQTALLVASMLGADWAVRVDFILEHSTDRLMFLECDAAPLVGPGSDFAASLAAGGMGRAEQLAKLLREA